MYAALVAAAGYLPLTLSGEDYLELLPVEWRQINAYGIRIDYRTYDCPELGPWRLQHSGVTARRGLWEVHYDPYDATQVFVRTPGRMGHRAMDAPADGRPRRSPSSPGATPAAWPPRQGLDDTNETEVARVLDELLTRAQAGPVDKLSDRIAARTRVAAAAHRPPPRDDADASRTGDARRWRRRRPAGDRDPVRDLRRRRRGGAVVTAAGDHRCRGESPMSR